MKRHERNRPDPDLELHPDRHTERHDPALADSMSEGDSEIERTIEEGDSSIWRPGF